MNLRIMQFSESPCYFLFLGQSADNRKAHHQFRPSAVFNDSTICINL
jgi:hypothetical protein